MLFFKHLSLSTTFFSIIALGSPLLIIPRDVEISSPPTRDAICPKASYQADEIIAAVKQGHKWVQSGQRGGNDNTYPRTFHVKPEEVYSDSEYAGEELWEYPLLTNGKNPWVPGRRTRIPGVQAATRGVRVIFISVSETEVIFVGVVAKNENSKYEECPI
ncbi:MAG: hypothetical protein Q9221_007755 [Calogaya cf. arnoldii]